MKTTDEKSYFSLINFDKKSYLLESLILCGFLYFEKLVIGGQHIAEFSKTPAEQEVLFDLGATFEILLVNHDTIPLTIKMNAVPEGNRLAHDYVRIN